MLEFYAIPIQLVWLEQWVNSFSHVLYEVKVVVWAHEHIIGELLQPRLTFHKIFLWKYGLVSVECQQFVNQQSATFCQLRTVRETIKGIFKVESQRVCVPVCWSKDTNGTQLTRQTLLSTNFKLSDPFWPKRPPPRTTRTPRKATQNTQRIQRVFWGFSGGPRASWSWEWANQCTYCSIRLCLEHDK